MIFAAGLGTRLREHTRHRPKALVAPGNMPLLAFALKRMQAFGIRQVVVNVHHFGEQIIAFLDRNTPPGMEVNISDERHKLLDTGGGLRKAAPRLSDATHILLWNVDVVADIDFRAFAKFHLEHRGIASLAVSKRHSSRQLLFNHSGLLCGRKDNRKGQVQICRKANNLQQRAFSGIHLIRSELLNLLPDKDVFSIIEAYLQLCPRHAIYAWQHQPESWIDAGKPEALPKAAKLMQQIMKNENGTNTA